MTNPALRNPHLEGESFFWPGGLTGVLLIHGFTATTAEVRLLGKYLHDRGYTVSGPLLPGHGTTPQDLARCRWQDWAGAVEQAYQHLASRCKRVFIGGESMGALLTLYLASQTLAQDAVALLTFAPALLVSPGRMLLARLLAPFVFSFDKQPGPPAASDDRWQGYPVNPLKAVMQLNELQREVRRRLPAICQPLLVVQGRLDDAIDPRCGEIMLREVMSPVKELHWFERSTHCVILDQEWEAASALTLQFIERL